MRYSDHGLVVGGGLDPTAASMRAYLQDALDQRLIVVGWNIQFDIMWFLAYGLEDLVMQLQWLDGMLLWRHATIEPEYETDRAHKKSYSLKTCVAELFPHFAGYQDGVDFHDDSAAARKKLHGYNLRDTTFTLLCTRHWFEQLTPAQRRAALLEAQCIPLVARANLHGMLIDTLAAHELQAHLIDTAQQKLASLSPHGVTEKVVRSPLQLAKLLFDNWKLPVLKENTGKKTGKISRATDKEVLHELAFIDPRAKELREYREALNNKTKFADAPLEAVDYNEDDCAHPQAIIFGTYSGRLTYASKQGKNKDERQIGFALHQEKNDKKFRNIVTVPDGYTLVEFDAAGQEFRWMALASGDETMLQLCLPGEDPHSFMGARIISADYRTFLKDLKCEDDDLRIKTEADRKLGKVGNLSLQYRTSPRKLRVVARVQYNLPMELPQAQVIHATYQRTYTQVPVYWNHQIQQTRRQGYVETFAGRRVRVVGDWTGPNGWSMGSTAINFKIQGTGADQKYLALAVIKPYLIQIGAYFAWDLHDGIYLYVPTEKVQRAAVDIKRMLDNLPYRAAWGFTPSIPLPWDCKAGGSWGTLRELK